MTDWQSILDGGDELALIARCADRQLFAASGLTDSPWMRFLRADVEAFRKRIAMAHHERERIKRTGANNV